MRSDTVAQGFVQLSLENLQGGKPQSLFGQHVPLPGCLHSENITSHMQPEHLLSWFMPIVPLPPISHSCEKPVSVSLITFLQALGGCS